MSVFWYEKHSKYTVATQYPCLFPINVTQCDFRKNVSFFVYLLFDRDQQIIHTPSNICLIPHICYFIVDFHH